MAADPKDIWAFLQCSEDAEVPESSLELLAETRRLAAATRGRSCALLVGKRVRHLVTMLGGFGVDVVYTHEEPTFSAYEPERIGSVLEEAVRKYLPLLVLFPGTDFGNDLACRASNRIGARFFRNCVNFEVLNASKVSLVRPVYNGYLYSTETSDSLPVVASLLPRTVGIEKIAGGRAPLETTLAPTEPHRAKDAREPVWVKGDPRTVDLVEADVIVAGGRGLGRPEGLELLQELADQLGGSLGVSRPLVDEKWAPFDKQVGQTGRTVRPKLYVACGISGAVQHIMGMRGASTIVAINKDPAAPIFDVAAVAAEGDLYEIVPELIRRLRERKGQA